MAPSEQLTYQIQTLRGLIAGTKPEQMTARTPCTDWNVHGLVNHFVGGGHMFAAEVTPPSDASPMEKLVAFTGRKI